MIDTYTCGGELAHCAVFFLSTIVRFKLSIKARGLCRCRSVWVAMFSKHWDYLPSHELKQGCISLNVCT